VRFFFSHFIEAMLFPADIRLRKGEPGIGVNVERRQNVGN
jgi:hypothetical protein